MPRTFIPSSLVISDGKWPIKQENAYPEYIEYINKNRWVKDEIAFRPEMAQYYAFERGGWPADWRRSPYYRWMIDAIRMRGEFHAEIEVPDRKVTWWVNRKLKRFLRGRYQLLQKLRRGAYADNLFIKVEAPNPRWEFEIIDGHHRIAALKALGRAWVGADCADPDIEQKWRDLDAISPDVRKLLFEVTEVGDPATDVYLPLLLPSFREFKIDRPGSDRLDRMFLALKDLDLDGKRVLDIGCHIGFFSLHFLRKGARVTGVDRKTAAVEISRMVAEQYGFKDGQFLKSELLGPEFPEQNFDVVLLLCVLHHVFREGGAEAIKQVAARLARMAPKYCFIELPYDPKRVEATDTITRLLQEHSPLTQYREIYRDGDQRTLRLFTPK